MNQKEKQDVQEKYDYRYSTANIDEIIQYYAKDFIIKDSEIKSWDYWLDTNKQEVIFRLFVKKIIQDV